MRVTLPRKIHLMNQINVLRSHHVEEGYLNSFRFCFCFSWEAYGKPIGLVSTYEEQDRRYLVGVASFFNTCSWVREAYGRKTHLPAVAKVDETLIAFLGSILG